MLDGVFGLVQAHTQLLWGVLIWGVACCVAAGLVALFSARWAWLAGVLGGTAALGAVWFAGAYVPIPQFMLDPHDPGQVVPIDESWFGRLADRLRGRKYLVLSFDDGPADSPTDQAILRILARHHAHAMFFTICARGQSAAGRAALRADVAAGDLVEDHSFTHPHLTQLDRAQLRHQIVDSRHFLRQVVAPQSVEWFRPPFGQANAAVLAEIRAAGMHLMLWGANSQDSWLFQPRQILRWATRQSYSGAILLMHSRPTTAAALDATLGALQRMGYRFVLPRQPGDATRANRAH